MSTYDLNLNLIKEMIGRIEKDLNKSLEDGTVWDAMLMRLQVIGENIDKLPREAVKRHSEINWKKYYAFRNLISHTYLKVPMDLVMEMISELPALKKAVIKMKGKLK